MQQELFLTDSNDHLADNLGADINLWSGDITIPKYDGPRAKSFSTMLLSSSIFLYDHPDVLQKYPHGFYGENLIFIPVNMYENMKDNEQLAINDKSVNSYWNMASLLFIPIYTAMIEHKYNVTFSASEKQDIIVKSLEHAFYESGAITGHAQTGLYNMPILPSVDNEEETSKRPRYKYTSSVNKEDIKRVSQEIFDTNVGKP